MPSPKHPTLCLLFSNGVYTAFDYYDGQKCDGRVNPSGGWLSSAWSPRCKTLGSEKPICRQSSAERERGMQRGLIEESGKKTRGAGGGGQRGKK